MATLTRRRTASYLWATLLMAGAAGGLHAQVVRPAAPAPLAPAAQPTTPLPAAAPPVTAPAIPQDPAGFTDYVAGQFRASLTDAPITIKAPLSLMVGELQANLERIFASCNSNAATCPQEVAVYVRGASQVYQDQNTPLTRDAVRLVVRSTQYVQQTQSTLPPGAPALQASPLVEGLVVLPVLDTPRAIRMLNDKDFKALGLTANQVHQLALKNLRATLQPLTEVAKPATRGQIGQLAGDTFSTSRLALLDTWAPLAKAQGGKLIVAAPATDAVYYVGEDTPGAVDALRSLARNVMDRTAHPLSDIVLRWKPSGWEVMR